MAVASERAQAEDARVSAADLYARHASQLFRFCLSQLRNRAEAEDAVQTTFLQAFRALQRGTIPHVERAWLIAIAQNVCRTMQRSSARRRVTEVDADPEEVAGTTDADPPLREEISELERALARIPANQRRALVLHEWHGLRYREIAGVMGVSQTAVEMLAFRARRSLSQALGAGSSRVRQALDVGGILTAIRGLLSVGSGVHALAGAGIAGLALTTLGASAAPAHQNATGVRSRPTVAVARPASRPPVLRPTVRSARSHQPTVVHLVTAPRHVSPAVAAAPSPSLVTAGTAAPVPTSSPSPHPTVTTPTAPAPPISLPPTPSAPALPPTPPAPALPVTAPTLPPVPSVTVPQLPPLPVSTPTVTLPSP